MGHLLLLLLAQIAAPSLALLPDGRVVLTCATPGAVIRYTLDGSVPDRSSGAYLAPIVVPIGKQVMAKAFLSDGSEVSPGFVGAIREADPSTVVPVTQNRDWKNYDWVQRHQAILELARKQPPHLIFIGDSITHFFGGSPVDAKLRGPDVWEKYYSRRRALNLGYGWDRTENVLWRLQHGEVDGIAPKVAVVMIGTNNAGLNTAPEIANGIRKICEDLHQRLPYTRILLLGIFPRGAQPNPAREKVAEVNTFISKLDGDLNVTYLDIGKVLLAPDGSISPEVMNDYLHPTAAG